MEHDRNGIGPVHHPIPLRTKNIDREMNSSNTTGHRVSSGVRTIHSRECVALEWPGLAEIASFVSVPKVTYSCGRESL